MATTTTNFGWDIPQSTDLVKDGATAIAALGQDIDTALVDLKGGTTGQILAKASNTDLDYSWITNDVGDITAVTAGTGISGGGTSGAVTITNSMATAITTAGDLIKGTGSGTFDRLGIGSTGQVLTVAAGAPTWATPSGGLTLINRSTFSNVASHTIDSIFSSTYKSYLVSIEFIYAATSTDALGLRFRVGGTTLSTASYYANNINAAYTSSTVTNTGQNGATNLTLALKTGSATGATTGFLNINRVGNSSEIPSVIGTLSNTADVLIYNVTGETITGDTYTGLHFFSASNITGAISVYGLAI